MNKEEIQRALKQFGFDEKWLEFGLLSEDFLLKLQEQSAQEQSAQDLTLRDVSEHYRYKAFKNALDSRTMLNDEFIKNYVALAQVDNCSYMARSALIGLI